MEPHEYPLRKPKKRFGILPDSNLIAHLIVFAFFSISLIGSFINLPDDFSAVDQFGIISRSIVVFLYVAFILINIRNLDIIYLNSRRLRYYRAVVLPHLKKRYGFKIKISGMHDLMLFGMVRAKLHGYENVGITGFGLIEQIADRETNEDLTSNDVLLVQDVENGEAREELPRSDYPGATLQRLVAAPEPISLEEFEYKVRIHIMDYISRAKPGQTDFTLVTPGDESGEVESNPLQHLQIEVSDDGSVIFSGKDVDSLVGSIIFGVRLFSESLLVVSRSKNDGSKPTAAGVIFRENESRPLKAYTIRQLMNTGDDAFTFVSSVEEL